MSDQGIGIPENEQKFLFEKFFRANNTGTVQGTGLGLAIVRCDVDLMGGKITFKSSIDKGTTFNVALPYLESDEDNTGH
ncbi:sensor histidine kinase [Dyadobacter psychrotolerans]|uniref:histidine kinase n=1 Tax=Dyadobacter psychrotolerans TaxID=2541721 RepID=A0A4R5DW37_9BACT|nr:HAMP domain-containing histidine kinase [Dyadobacter psychrotolerans]